MNATFAPARMRISVDRYQKMVATGVLASSDRVELIEGDILSRAPITPRHASVIARSSCTLRWGGSTPSDFDPELMHESRYQTRP